MFCLLLYKASSIYLTFALSFISVVYLNVVTSMMQFQLALKSASPTRLNSKHEACVISFVNAGVCVGVNPLHEGLFVQRAIPSAVQGLEVWAAWLHHQQLLFLSFPSLASAPSLHLFLHLLSLHSRCFSPIFLAVCSPSTSLNHPLFCPLSYVRCTDHCTDDSSLQIFSALSHSVSR